MVATREKIKGGVRCTNNFTVRDKQLPCSHIYVYQKVINDYNILEYSAGGGR